jgi:hypothetical protein
MFGTVLSDSLLEFAEWRLRVILGRENGHPSWAVVFLYSR